MQKRQYLRFNCRERFVNVAQNIEIGQRLGGLCIRRIAGAIWLNFPGALLGYRPTLAMQFVEQNPHKLLLLQLTHAAMSFTNASTSASVVSHEHINRAAPSGPTSL